MEGKLEGFEPVKAGWELDEVDGFELDTCLFCERLGFLGFLAARGFLGFLAARGLALEWVLELNILGPTD